MSLSKVDYLRINLNRKNAVFNSGETIFGSIELKLLTKTKINSLKMLIKGLAICEWKDGNDKSKISSHVGCQAFLNTYVNFIQNQDNPNEFYFDPGVYSYQFVVKLPDLLQTSYSDSIGRVEYKLRAELEIPWTLATNFDLPITIIYPLDLNTLIFTVNKSVSLKVSKTFCCFCCKSMPVLAELLLFKTGYVTGEEIRFTVNFHNKSSRNITLTAALVREVRYTAGKKVKTFTKVICKIDYEKNIEPNEQGTWDNGALNIPFVQPSTCVVNSQVINIDYALRLIIKSTIPSIGGIVKSKIYIGYIPYRNLTQNNQISYNVEELKQNPFEK